MEWRLDSMALEDLLVGIRLQVLEGQILEFAAHLAHAEAVRDRRVDLDGFARDALAPLRAEVAQRAHVVYAVGQFDQDDADVLDHGEQHLADALGLAVFGREYIELGELGDAVDAARHLGAELLAHLLDGDAGVLHDVVQQAGLHGHHVHPHVGENVRHHDGMGHVRLAGIARLALVIFAGEAEGLLRARRDRPWDGTRGSWLPVRRTTAQRGRTDAVLARARTDWCDSEGTLIRL